MSNIGLHTVLFKREFQSNTANLVVMAEDRYVRFSVLGKLYPNDYLNLANVRNSSTFFSAIIHRYFPNRQNELASQLANDLKVLYNCDVLHWKQHSPSLIFLLN